MVLDHSKDLTKPITFSIQQGRRKTHTGWNFNLFTLNMWYVWCVFSKECMGKHNILNEMPSFKAMHYRTTWWHEVVISLTHNDLRCTNDVLCCSWKPIYGTSPWQCINSCWWHKVLTSCYKPRNENSLLLRWVLWYVGQMAQNSSLACVHFHLSPKLLILRSILPISTGKMATCVDSLRQHFFSGKVDVHILYFWYVSSLCTEMYWAAVA